MATTEELFGVAPVAARGADWQISPEVQLERDRERRRILEREAVDPRYDADTQAAVRREVSRMPAETAASYATTEDLFGGAPAQPAASGPGRLARLGLEAARNTASVGEMVLGVPAQALSVMAEVNSRLSSLLQGRGSAEAAQLAGAERDRILQTYSPRFLTELVNQMAPKGEAPSPSQVERGMGAFMDLVQRDARAVEERTGGLLKEEDVMGLVNEGLALFGIKAPLAVKRGVQKSAGAAAQPRYEIPGQTAGKPDAPAAPPRVDIFNAETINQALNIKPTRQRQAETRARREEVRETFREQGDLADYLAFKAEERAANARVYEAQLAARRAEVAAAREAQERIGAGVGGPRTGLREGQQLGETGPVIPPRNVALETGAPTTLDAALEKIRQGREFELTAAEKVAVRGTLSSFGNRVLVPPGQRGGINLEDLMDVFRNNASGESPASLEAIGRLREEAALGRERLLVDRDGTVRPLIGVDAVDQAARPGQVILQRGVGKDEWTVMSSGEGVTQGGQARALEAVRKRGQQGGVDPELLKTLGLTGAGALAGSLLADEETGNALLSAGVGGVLGLGLARGGKALARGADYGLGSLSTRIRNISEPLAFRGREYERRVLGDTHTAISRVDPFLVQLQKLPAAQRDRLSLALISNDTAQIDNLLQSYPGLQPAWTEVRKVLDEAGAKLQQHNRLASLREDYFPRVVTDYEGLSAKLGAPARTALERRLFEADKASIKATGQGLSELERSKIVNQYLRGLRTEDYAPGFAKGRRIDAVTADLQPFYANPAESLHTYLSAATRDVEKARFFGRDVARDPKTGRINLDASIGNLVQKELAAGKIDGKQAVELESMLRSRFGPGERSASPLVQDVKNWMNAGLLGNVFSAATQLGDVGTTVYMQGMRPTLEALTRRLTGQQRVSAKDFGLADHISEEFVNTRSSAKFLNKVFKLSGFSAIDMLGKDTLLNAALVKAERQATTARGQRALQAKYGEAFGQDFPQLLADLQAKRMTDNTRAYLFSELSDMQPISKMELPQGYLDMPNGRSVYMLKTFMLKQADIVRRDAYNEIRKGNRAKGLYNLARFGLVLGTAGATTQMLKDWMMGREVNFEATDIAENLLKTFGWSSYVLDKARQGKPVEATGGTLLPPYQMVDQLIAQDPRALQYIPLVGKPIYHWGTEDAQLREERRQEREANRE